MTTFDFLRKRELGLNRKGRNALQSDFLLSGLVSTNKKSSPNNCFFLESSLPLACKYSTARYRNSSLLAVTYNDGRVSFYQPDSNRPSITLDAGHQISPGSGNAVFDICWFPKSSKYVLASGDNSAYVYDLSNLDCSVTFRSHTASVKTVDVCQVQPNVFATGARDGKICVWDIRVPRHDGSPEIEIVSPHSASNFDSKIRKVKQFCAGVSTVLFQDEHHLCSAGTKDNAVKVWDLRRTYIRKFTKASKPPTASHNLIYGGSGCASMVFDSTFNHLYACSTDHKIYKYDCHTYKPEPVCHYYGLKVSTFFVKLAISCDDQYLLSGCGSNDAHIWNVSSPGPPICGLYGHEAEVTSVAWDPYDLTSLCTCSDDYKTLIWDIHMREGPRKEDQTDFLGSAKLFPPVCLELTNSPEPVKSSKDKLSTLESYFSTANSSPEVDVSSTKSPSFLSPTTASNSKATFTQTPNTGRNNSVRTSARDALSPLFANCSASNSPSPSTPRTKRKRNANKAQLAKAASHPISKYFCDSNGNKKT